MRMLLRVLVVVLLLGCVSWLVYKNDEPLVVDLVFGKIPVESWQLILGSLLLGALAAALACSWPLLRYRLRLRKSRQRIAELEQEIHGLRTLPLGDDEVERVREARAE